jgi:hypothetical protein
MKDMEQDGILREIVKKLQSQIWEIRERAMESLLFKIRNDIISIGEISYDQEFLYALLSWFNFPQFNREQEVLLLILRLSTDSLTARMMIDIGGYEFLNQMKHHLSGNVSSDIIENIEKILQTLEDPKHRDIWMKLEGDITIMNEFSLLWTEEEKLTKRRMLEGRITSAAYECKS